jgi:hypothetical protein
MQGETIEGTIITLAASSIIIMYVMELFGVKRLD